ncbi:MAG: LysM peptidoglycan-binding domain-containing protein [Halobacteriovoraceae bacterium]|jgi:membrane-bound lytic murein transglycosylase D|nr:LysM peptidoglycan-binding domain-containing protein [Halobacteriovoraceae bacterium]
MHTHITLLVSFFLLFVSCSHIQPTNQQLPEKKNIVGSKVHQIDLEQIEQDYIETASNHKEKVKRPTHFLKDVRSKKVKFWIKYFTTKNKERFKRFVANGDQYREIVEQTFEKYGLPKELYYVGLIESGYQNRAKSRASAVGPWQFMRGTAKDYGLLVTRSIDERKSIQKSTQAAALYFEDLYNIFGSWELALAAYNAGENGVIRRLRKANTRDYYELCDKKVLPKETRHYIPKVLAVKEILENPQKYGIKSKRSKNNIYSKTKSHRIYSAISLNKLAKKLKISSLIIKKLNHDIERNSIPYIGRKGFEIYLPTVSKQLLSHYSKIFKQQKKSRSLAIIKAGINTHTVRRNENLIGISKRYHTSVKTLKRLNNLRSNKILIGQKLKLTKRNRYKQNSKMNKHAKSYYIIKKGDHLSRIANMFKTSITKIKKMNQLRTSRVRFGQRLKVPNHKAILYTVKPGDGLIKIARKTKQDLRRIKQLNNLSRNIYPGQRLIVAIKLI